MDRNLANLAKLALAGLYRQTARDAQASRSTTESSPSLLRRYRQRWRSSIWQTSTSQKAKLDQARALWAKVKDADKDGTAGSLAAQKLAAK